MTQSAIILATLRKRFPEWLYSYELQKARTEFGWIGPSGERRCGELREAGLIEQRDAGKFVQYRATAPKTYETGIDAETGEVLYRRPVYQ